MTVNPLTFFVNDITVRFLFHSQRFFANFFSSFQIQTTVTLEWDVTATRHNAWVRAICAGRLAAGDATVNCPLQGARIMPGTDACTIWLIRKYFMLELCI